MIRTISAAVPRFALFLLALLPVLTGGVILASMSFDLSNEFNQPAGTGPDDPGFWLYSSGSTGMPKGTRHLHGSPMATAKLFAQDVLGFGPDDLALGSMQRTPVPDPPLQRPARKWQIAMPAAQLLKDRNRPQPRGCFQQRHNLLVEEPCKRIRATTPARRFRLGGQLRLLQQPIARSRAHSRLRRSHSHRVVFPQCHKQPHLMIGYVTARHTGSSARKTPSYPTPRSSPASPQRGPPVCRDPLRATPYAASAGGDSHLD